MSRDILAELRERQSADLPVLGGRTLAYVYDSGWAEVDRIGREAVAAYAGSNGLDPTAFPSVLAMENDLVGFALDLVSGPDEAVGTVTSGGTESVLLAVQAARDAHPEITDPSMVLPVTAHAAFHKAAHYFGVRAVMVEVGADFRPDPAAMAAAIDATTVLTVASAPSYAHGVVDPVAPIAAAAAAAGVRCHVDACIGGWVLPFAERIGRPVPAWDFRVPGVTSISLDTHKYAYTPKGTSLLLHRSPELRMPQIFASARWPGYTMLNATMQSTRSGGPVAGAWAVVRTIGVDGYTDLARRVFDCVDALAAAIESIEGIALVARPESTLLTFGTDDTCDPFTIVDLLTEQGWYVQPQMRFEGHPATVHLSVSAATAEVVEEFVAALTEAVARARARGPVTVDPGIAAFIEALDAATLGPAEFDGLLTAAGLVGQDSTGGLQLPRAMAEVNALIDLAAPDLREALMVAFLDLLSRPTRGAWAPS